MKEKSRPTILTSLQIDIQAALARNGNIVKSPQDNENSKIYPEVQCEKMIEKNFPTTRSHSYPPASLGTPVGLTVVKVHVLFLDFSRRRLLFHSTKPNLFPPTILTDIASVRHAPALQVPLLNAANDIHAQLPILLQRILPMGGNGIAQGQISRDAVDHHLAHLVVLARVGVDVLHPP